MPSWFQKLSQPAFFLATAVPLAIAAFSFSWYQDAKSRESSKSTSTPSISEPQAPQKLVNQGFLSLQKYCELPPVASSGTTQSAVAASPCPNWLAEKQAPENSTIATEKNPPQSPWPAFLKPITTNTNEQIIPSPNLPPVSPFPELNRQARLARVPIFMYHDILPKKEVFFDVTPQELEAHFQRLKKEGVTPISPDWLLTHLKTGVPLPEKPVLLTFDDGYGGHYKYVYPLLKKYNYPAVFSVYVKKMDSKTGRSSLTWEQLKEMATNPLVTIASHSVTHPKDLRELSDDQVFREVMDSKRILQQRLGIPINYFTYPEGKLDARIKQWVIAAGYQMAFSMDDANEKFAGDSPDLLSLGRFGQSRLTEIAPQAWGGYPAPVASTQFNFTMPIEKREYAIDGTEVILISGGRPGTIHADSRYQVPEILKDTGAIAGVDGGFFSLKYLDSNTMIGPIFSANHGFIPGNASENLKLRNRPLILISSQWAKFVPFIPESHNTITGIQQISSQSDGITDAFVGAAWLVRNDKPQPAANFGNLSDYYIPRHRAFWGINLAGIPIIGVTKTPVDSVSLGRILYQLGVRDAVMLDSGASTSLAYHGESLVGYKPRPVPHAVVLYPASQPQQPKLVSAESSTKAR